MTETTEPFPAPDDLHERGRRFWEAVASEHEVTAAEGELLAEVCRALSELDALHRAVADEGVTVVGSRGQRRAHPALAEIRNGRDALRRLLGALGLPADAADDGGELSAPSRQARRAARARWARRGAA